MRSHRVTFRAKLEHALPSSLGDRVQLEQVIINLIMNAIDAMTSADDRIRELVIRSEQRQDHQIVISVDDSGIGLDGLDTDRLFDPFFTTKPSGMGMGLPIAVRSSRRTGDECGPARTPQ
jgi:C4-dicarboxylate-specific signal transduction histidine kinase